MLKLIKHLKPFVWSLVAIFALLFVQAMTDLALPGYMADIVNIGIQANGVENAVPEAIRASEYDKLALFMNETDKSEVGINYLKLDKNTLSEDDFVKYVIQYPDLADEPLYILNTSDGAEIEKLNTIFLTPEFVVIMIEQQGNAIFKDTGIVVPEGADPFAIIAQLTPEQMAALSSSSNASMSALPVNIKTQTATVYVTKEYKIIGIDMLGLQTRYILRVGGIMLLITLLGAACSVATRDFFFA